LNIKVLDCTLRDGGYINNWEFSNSQTDQIINSLVRSKVDIIEFGYLKKLDKLPRHSTIYGDLDIQSLKISKSPEQMFVAMIDLYSFDIECLPPNNNTNVDGIRLAFHKKDRFEALKHAKKIIQLGYKVFIQPMLTKTYSSSELRDFIAQVNEINPYAFYIVDSFGSLSLDQFVDLVDICEEFLSQKILIGYHSHNNMQLAFSNAIYLSKRSLNHDVIIDSSILGMGRGAGNLNTELITDFLNNNNLSSYDIYPLIDVIDEVLMSIYKINPWGFSPAQYLSATFDCHPNYASFLINKKINHISDLRKIISLIKDQKKSSFDIKYISELYNEFIDKNSFKERGKISLNPEKKIILIASGSSVAKYSKLLKEKSDSNKFLFIALNHIPSIKCDYYFFSNQQRFDKFKDRLKSENIITTSNIHNNEKFGIVINLKKLRLANKGIVFNSALLCIKYLVNMKVREVQVAGLDGFKFGRDNYSYDESSSIAFSNELIDDHNKEIKSILQLLNKEIEIRFVTPSIFQDIHSPKIVGVIPARYKSSRFEGKPLFKINGIPMIKRTYDQVKDTSYLNKLLVATDDERIYKYCLSENIPVVMTDTNHLTGTDRIAEIAKDGDYDLYINIQGDEPVIDKQAIADIVNFYKDKRYDYEVYALYKEIDVLSEVENNSIIKVIVNEEEELVYMSRYPVPFNKSKESPKFKKQVCVYGYTQNALREFAITKKTINEQYEDIELLRFIDLGKKIKMIKTDVDSIAVDYPSDVKKVEEFLNKRC